MEEQRKNSYDPNEDIVDRMWKRSKNSINPVSYTHLRRGDRIWQNDISECAFRLHSKGRAHHNHRRQCRAADPGCGESGAAGSKRGKSGIRNRNYDPRSDPRSFAYAAGAPPL